MTLNLILGILGMLSILVAFILDEFVQQYNTDTYFYNFLNIVGAGLLLYYAYTLNSWPFAILNSVWVVAAMIKLGKLANK